MRRAVTAMVFLLFLQLPNEASPAFAWEERCAEPTEVTVTTATAADAEGVCIAAQRAVAFLAGYGLAPRRAIAVRIVEDVPDHQGVPVYGNYDSRSDQVSIYSYAAIMRAQGPTIYGEPFDRDHYGGAVAHEVAHAVIQHNLQVKPLSTVAQEYLAHATQLAALPETRRQAILDAVQVGAWESGDAISDVYMAMQPDRFAVKSYRHLTTMADPSAFVRQLMRTRWYYVYAP